MQLPIMNTKGEPVLVHPKEIAFIQMQNSKIKIFSYNEEYKMISSLRELSAFLDESKMQQIDRGTIVNLDYVQRFDPALCALILKTHTGMIVPVSKSNEKRILNCLAQEGKL